MIKRALAFSLLLCASWFGCLSGSAVAGESFAFQYFSTNGGDGLLAFAGMLPGEMRAIELTGQTWFAEKDAFVAAEAGVDFDIAFSGMRTGFSGGEGFVL